MSWVSLSSRYALLAGFSLLLALLLGVSVLSIARTEQVNRRLQDVINEQDTKTKLVAAMLRVSRDRAQLMVSLFNEQDLAVRARSSERYVDLARELQDLTQKLG